MTAPFFRLLIKSLATGERFKPFRETQLDADFIQHSVQRHIQYKCFNDLILLASLGETGDNPIATANQQAYHKMCQRPALSQQLLGIALELHSTFIPNGIAPTSIPPFDFFAGAIFYQEALKLSQHAFMCSNNPHLTFSRNSSIMEAEACLDVAIRYHYFPAFASKIWIRVGRILRANPASWRAGINLVETAIKQFMQHAKAPCLYLQHQVYEYLIAACEQHGEKSLAHDLLGKKISTGFVFYRAFKQDPRSMQYAYGNVGFPPTAMQAPLAHFFKQGPNAPSPVIDALNCHDQARHTDQPRQS